MGSQEKDIVERLKNLADPSAEAMSDWNRINAFVRVADEAADEIERLRQNLREAIALFDSAAACGDTYFDSWGEQRNKLVDIAGLGQDRGKELYEDENYYIKEPCNLE
jgi:ABC-type branched-subunit amino acid transport system substrate-binding protein